MILSHSCFSQLRRRLRLAAAAAPAVVGLSLLLNPTAHAKPIPDNLGNGLDKVVESQLALKAAKKTGAALSTFVGTDGRRYTSEQAAKYGENSLVDADGRILVRINPDGSLRVNKLRKALKSGFDSLSVTATDKEYRGVGVMNAYVDVADVPALAQAPGVKSVILETRPQIHRAKAGEPTAVPGAVYPKLGRAFDQGVTQHRVDQINRFYNSAAALDYQGAGISIGFLSDSYDNLAGAATGVTNYDLPGSSSHPVGNAQPVDIVEEYSGGDGSDEGRAMVEIGHKMAPKARLAFASAFTGEVGFANNIRALAGLQGFTKPGQTFAGDVVCDDVGYGDEPFYQDGIIGAAVDDAAAAGVSYFASAANDPGITGYESPARWVVNGAGLTAAAGNTALTGTNIDLTGVPAALYAGGFHNFNPNGLDVAQTVNIASNANQPATVLQWNEPYDQNTSPNLIQPPLYTASGTITGATAVNFTIPASLTQGTLYRLSVTAAPSSVVDVIVTLRDPNGVAVVNAQDTGSDEQVTFFAPVTGAGYTVSVSRFGTTTGAFNLILNASTGYAVQGVVTDINLLAFNATTGAYVSTSSLVANNFATNQPIESGATLRPTGATQLQYVISRGNVPASGGATQLRYLISGNGLSGIGPAEYFAYNTVATRGHSMAAGCNGSAAYSVFRPSIPESFTSPGPVVIYFDKLGNRLATPEVRLQPTIAAADAANTSFFSGDSGNDQDSSPNFSGTSAAAPHGAAVAALVLEAKGGRRSVTPRQMTSLLQRSAFSHDLDTFSSSGSARVVNGSTGAGKVTITAVSDNSANAGTGANDNNAISVSYIGGSAVTSLVFNPAGTAATAGNTSGGNNGTTYTGNVTGGTVTYFENSYPGMVWAPVSKAFTIGSASTVPLTALTGGVPLYTNVPPAPSTTQFWTMTLNFNSTSFTGGNTLRFNVGRAIQHSAATGNTATIGAGTTAVNYQADLLGGSISLPSGVGAGVGMAFSGTTADGGVFQGTINNRIGKGYSNVDGFGFLNAEAAVQASVQ